MKKIAIGLVLVFAVLVSGCAGPKQVTQPMSTPSTTEQTIAPSTTEQTITPSTTDQTMPLVTPSTTDQTMPSTTEQTMPSGVQSTTVDIMGLAFNPSTITVPSGTTIIWTNRDSVSHTVTGSNFDSGSIPPGGTFSQTFNNVGTFTYGCTIHTTMKGGVVVT